MWHKPEGVYDTRLSNDCQDHDSDTIKFEVIK